MDKNNEYVTKQENGIAVQQEVDKSVQQYKMNKDQLESKNAVHEYNEKESQQDEINFDRDANIGEKAANEEEKNVGQKEIMLQKDVLLRKDNAAEMNINVQKKKIFRREEKIDQQEKTIAKLNAKIKQVGMTDQHVQVKTTLMKRTKVVQVNNEGKIKQENDNAGHEENGKATDKNNEYVTKQENGITVQQEVDKSVQQYKMNKDLDQLESKNAVHEYNEKESQLDETNFNRDAHIEEKVANEEEKTVRQEEIMLKQDVSPQKCQDNTAQMNVFLEDKERSKALKKTDNENLLAALPDIYKDICKKTVKYKGDLHYVEYEAWDKIKHERELLELDLNKIKNNYDTKNTELLRVHETCITENFTKQQEEIKEIELDSDRNIQKSRSLDLGDERFQDEQRKILQSKRELNRIVILNHQNRKMELEKSLKQQMKDLKYIEENEIQEKKRQCEATISLNNKGLKHSISTIIIKNHHERKQLIENRKHMKLRHK